MDQNLSATVLDLPLLTQDILIEGLGGSFTISLTAQRRVLKHRRLQWPRVTWLPTGSWDSNVLNLALLPKLSPTPFYYVKTQKV